MAMALQEDLAEQIAKHGSRGVLIDISALEFVDSFIGRMLSDISGIGRVLDADIVVVGMRPVVVHGVQHMFHPPRRLDAWPDEDHRTRIVVIGKDLDADLIRRLYDAFAGVPGLDAPDRSVLLDNPLAPPTLLR